MMLYNRLYPYGNSGRKRVTGIIWIWTAFTDLGAGLDFVVNWSVIPKLCLAFRVMANNKVHDFMRNPHTSVSRYGATLSMSE